MAGGSLICDIDLLSHQASFCWHQAKLRAQPSSLVPTDLFSNESSLGQYVLCVLDLQLSLRQLSRVESAQMFHSPFPSLSPGRSFQPKD